MIYFHNRQNLIIALLLYVFMYNYIHNVRESQQD